MNLENDRKYTQENEEQNEDIYDAVLDYRKNHPESEEQESVQKLASELYEDLKEKYILLKQHRDCLTIKLDKANKRIGKLSHKLHILRFGRKQFNFAVKLAKNLVIKSARENQFELNPICKLIGEIGLLHKEPITEDNKDIMNIDESIVDLELYSKIEYNEKKNCI